MKISYYSVMIIIGDTMKGNVSLIDLDFKSFNMEEKRYFLMQLDLCMKRYHQHGFLITSFNPRDIYYENDILYFDKVAPFSPMNSNSREEGILNNIAGLSNLAFCSYLPDYDLKNGLLNLDVVSDGIDRFDGIFNEVDFKYYKSVFDGYKNKKLPDIPYYYDYVDTYERNNPSSGKSTSMAYVKATEAGKLYSSQFEDGNESGFGNTFFFITMVMAMLILLSGAIFYFINI